MTSYPAIILFQPKEKFHVMRRFYPKHRKHAWSVNSCFAGEHNPVVNRIITLSLDVLIYN